MPDEQPTHNSVRRNNEPSLSTYLIWIAIIGLIPLIMIFRNRATSSGDRLNQHEFMQKLTNELIARAIISLDPDSPYLREIRGRYFKTDIKGYKVVEDGKHVEVPFYAEVFLTDQSLEKVLSKPEFHAKRPNTLLVTLIWSLGPILLVALLIYWTFIRQLRR